MASTKTKGFAKTASVAAISTSTFTYDAYSVPEGCTFRRFKITANNTSNLVFREVSDGVGACTWNNWNTNIKQIAWNGSGTYKIKLHNSASSTTSATVTVTFEYYLDPVTKGDKIVAQDRKKTGTSTSQGSVMKDDNFSAGTKITASSFNSAYDL